MIRIATFLVLGHTAVSPPGTAHGQATLAATGGVTFASYAVDEPGSDELEASSLRRYSAGLKLTIPFANRLLFRLDGSYAQRGTQADIRDFGAEVQADFETGHMELASLVGVRLPGLPGGVYLLAGPAVAYEFQCRATARGTFEGIEVETTEECSGEDDVNTDRVPFDLGVLGVVGFEVGFGALALSLEGLYHRGISDISDDDAATLRHRGTSIRAGIGVPLG